MDIYRKPKHKSFRTIVKEKRDNFITGIKFLLLFSFDEINFVCLFLAMILFTITTKTHIDLIITLENTSLGFPMFGFVFMSVVNFCASLAFMKKRTLLSGGLIVLISGIVVFFVIYYLTSCMQDKYFPNNEFVLKSFIIVLIGCALTVLSIILGIIFSFISGKHDSHKLIFGRKKC